MQNEEISHLDCLDGLTLGEAFRKVVLDEPRVKILGEQISKARPSQECVFCEARYPGLCNDVWPIQATSWQIAAAFVSLPILFLDRPAPAPSRDEVSVSQIMADRLSKLISLLSSGRYAASGTFVGTGIELPISSGQWKRPDLYIDAQNSAIVEMRNYKNETVWTAVHLSRAMNSSCSHTNQSRTEVKIDQSKSLIRVQTKHNAAEAFKDWFRKAASDENFGPLTNDELVAYAAEQWPGKVGRKAVLRLKSEVLAQLSETQRKLWSQGGRRPKRI